MGSFTAVLDASVLYAAPIRDLLMELAVADLYRAKWSPDILGELKSAIGKNRPDLAPDRIERTVALMNEHARDALVENYAPLAVGLRLPDPNDVHVLAAAIKAGANLIVTANLKDFPAADLEPWGLEAQHPDDFLVHQYYLRPPVFLAAVRTVRQRLSKPALGVEEYLDALRRNGLLATVATIAPYNQFI